jgi:uncharacterized protein involved in response to NO
MRISDHTILSLGFRPFYLLAALFAVIALPVWMGNYFGLITMAHSVSGMAWHSHELIFGFASAVIAGFLLTAVQSWTGLPTVKGVPLLALAVIWVLGRVLLFTGPSGLAAAIDLAFLPCLAVSIAVPIFKSRSTRNLKVIIVLGGLACTNIAYHLAQLGVVHFEIARLSIIVALDIIVILMAVMAGRVIPSFIANAVEGSKPKNVFIVEVLALGSLLFILAAEIIGYWYPIPDPIWISLLLVAGISHSVRLSLWQPLGTRHQTLLLMLPLAYVWVPVALVLRALTIIFPEVFVSSAYHALTIGAMASLMLAMMTRSALGHTGRELKAGTVETSAFFLLQCAVVIRILPGLIWPQQYQEFLLVSAFLWVLAFVVFLAGYWSILSRPRIPVMQARQ